MKTGSLLPHQPGRKYGAAAGKKADTKAKGRRRKKKTKLDLGAARLSNNPAIQMRPAVT